MEALIEPIEKFLNTIDKAVTKLELSIDERKKILSHIRKQMTLRKKHSLHQKRKKKSSSFWNMFT